MSIILASILLDSNGLKLRVQMRNVDTPSLGIPSSFMADPDRRVLLCYLWYVIL